MRINSTNSKDIALHLERLGVKSGMNLCIHSSLLKFGNIEGGIESIYRAIRSIIGSKSTIVVPTYNFLKGKNDIYDPVNTKPAGMGAFTNYVVSLDNSVRTLCPIHSHQIDGPLAEILMSADPKMSVGKGSIFETMMNHDFYLLLLGATFQQGATFVHHIEACNNVSYREWISLPRQIMDSEGNINEMKVMHFVKKENTTTNLRALEKKMTEDGLCSTHLIGHATSHLVNLSSLFKSTSKLLKDQPYLLIND